MSSYCKFYLEKKQVSYDNGVTFIDVVPAETRKGNLIQRDSPACGYVPPTPTNCKVTMYYEHELPYCVPCNSYSTLTSSDTYTSERDDTELINAVIGDCVNTIGAGAFFNVPSLKSVTIPNTVTTIESGAFSGCTSLSSVTIPDSVTEIGAYAFENCSGLSTVTIGSGITSIGMNAFVNCSGLTSITIHATTPPYFNVTSFHDTNNCPIYVPCESVNTYKTDTIWDMHANRIYGIPPCADYSNQYFTFVAIDSSRFVYHASSGNSSIQYSLDSGTTWSRLNKGVQSPTVSAGSKIMWKGEQIPKYAYGIGTFTSTGRFDVEGNAMSLLYGDNFSNQTSLFNKDNALSYLFKDNTNLINAANLILPATTLGDRCYQSMFMNCSSLITIPSLPATTLANSCYTTMFGNCTSLVTVPYNLLPATVLTYACYMSMFGGCTSLTTVPQLPATEVYDTCYAGMFFNCTSLVTVPYNLLPATSLVGNYYANACYESMFERCTSLTNTPQLPATTLTYACYMSMFKGCTSLTTAPNLPARTLEDNCYSGMFNGCTSLTTAPVISATTLSSGCCEYMFTDCTSLTTAPVLSASTLFANSYLKMFSGCTSLNYIKCLATDRSASGSTKNWVLGVSATGTFVKNSSMSNWPNGANGIPSGWTVTNA